MNYTDFSSQFLVAAYLEAQESAGRPVRSGDLLNKYDFNVAPLWIHTALEDWRAKGWISGKGVDGDEKSQPIRLTGSGLQHAEILVEIGLHRPQAKSHSKGGASPLAPVRAINFRQFEDQLLLALYRASEAGSDIVSFDRASQEAGLEYRPGWLVRAHDSLSGKGYVAGPANRRIEEMTAARLTPDGMLYVEDNLLEGSPSAVVDAEDDHSAPASNRLVRFDHNLPEYQQIATGILDVREAIRAANDLSVDEDERNRLIATLGSAQALWDAAQLKIVQIKVGILMALEDARTALARTTKAVAASLLVEAVKAFIKSHTGIDLDLL
jgi:hypothetical protein